MDKWTLSSWDGRNGARGYSKPGSLYWYDFLTSIAKSIRVCEKVMNCGEGANGVLHSAAWYGTSGRPLCLGWISGVQAVQLILCFLFGMHTCFLKLNKVSIGVSVILRLFLL
jgi:hypothetical protein